MISAAEERTGQLAEHGKLFQAIFEQAAIGVALVSTSSGKFLKINKKYCDIVGYSEEEMLNIDFQSITYPEDRKSDFEIVELLKSGKIREFSKEKRYIHKNGDIVWVNGTVSPMWDHGKQPSYHIKVVQDITERKQTEGKLKDAILEAQNEKNKSEAIISALGDGIIIQDKDYNIVYQNKIQTEIYGSMMESFVTKCMKEGILFVKIVPLKELSVMERSTGKKELSILEVAYHILSLFHRH